MPCLAVAAVSVVGCGGGTDYKNEPRPPAPIVVTASISKNQVSVSPRKFGAGPVTLIVTNQTGASQQLTLEINTGAAGFKGRTGPINPRDTGQLKADLRRGIYSVHVDGGSIRAARLLVGRQRPSAQDDLQQP